MTSIFSDEDSATSHKSQHRLTVGLQLDRGVEFGMFGALSLGTQYISQGQIVHPDVRSSLSWYDKSLERTNANTNIAFV